MGLFEDIKPINDLPDGKAFYLLGYQIKRKSTVYGEKDQFVLTVAWTEDGTAEKFSGYSAGILAQLGNSDRSDFPAWVKLETTMGSAGRSGTRRFIPAEQEVNTQLSADDDIPF